jgi:tetratricopeptide (TPR) repeat protein
MQLGNLYDDDLQNHDEALSSYSRAENIYRELGYDTMVGMVLNNMAITLGKLKRLHEARLTHQRAVQILEASGNAVEPWRSWNALASIELSSGNIFAAAAALQKARKTYVAYRRAGGENQDGTGHIAEAILLTGRFMKVIRQLLTLALSGRNIG